MLQFERVCVFSIAAELRDGPPWCPEDPCWDYHPDQDMDGMKMHCLDAGMEINALSSKGCRPDGSIKGTPSGTLRAHTQAAQHSVVTSSDGPGDVEAFLTAVASQGLLEKRSSARRRW